MEHPKREITGVVEGLVRAKTAEDQKKVLERYFTPDASFDHPMCAVNSWPHSRDNGILQIYQWLRIMFMDTLIEVHSVAYDESNKRIYIEATQTLRCNLSFIRSIHAPKATLVVLLNLVQGSDKKYYICKQQDVYPIQELPCKLIPGLSTMVMFMKLLVGILISIYVAIFQLFGVWTLKPTRTA